MGAKMKRRPGGRAPLWESAEKEEEEEAFLTV